MCCHWKRWSGCQLPAVWPGHLLTMRLLYILGYSTSATVGSLLIPHGYIGWPCLSLLVHLCRQIFSYQSSLCFSRITEDMQFFERNSDLIYCISVNQTVITRVSFLFPWAPRWGNINSIIILSISELGKKIVGNTAVGWTFIEHWVRLAFWSCCRFYLSVTPCRETRTQAMKEALIYPFVFELWISSEFSAIFV